MQSDGRTTGTIDKVWALSSAEVLYICVRIILFLCGEGDYAAVLKLRFSSGGFEGGPWSGLLERKSSLEKVRRGKRQNGEVRVGRRKVSGCERRVLTYDPGRGL